MAYLLRGLGIGLLFGVPVGAVGALTVQQTWNQGVRAGLVTGLGASEADCLYACVGAFGLTLISDFLLRWQTLITAAGGVLILLMGLKSLLHPQGEQDAGQASLSGIRLFSASFVVGITNPAAILTFILAFSTFGISRIDAPLDGALLVAGVLMGTYIWWGALAALTSGIKRRAARLRLRAMNRAFGGVLCAIGVAILGRLFF